MTISDTIKKEPASLKSRGIPDGSFFEVVFKDGSMCRESDANWSSLSEEVAVSCSGKAKMVMLSVHPIKKISVTHGPMSASIDVEEGDRVYQAIKSTATLGAEGETITKHIGRIVGIVRNGIVTEERFVSELTGGVMGAKF